MKLLLSASGILFHRSVSIGKTSMDDGTFRVDACVSRKIVTQLHHRSFSAGDVGQTLAAHTAVSGSVFHLNKPSFGVGMARAGQIQPGEMNIVNHTLGDRFAQLGLPSGNVEIEAFVAEHGAMPDGALLGDAPFWNEAQARFLRQQTLEDADRAQVVDDVNLMLHR